MNYLYHTNGNTVREKEINYSFTVLFSSSKKLIIFARGTHAQHMSPAVSSLHYECCLGNKGDRKNMYGNATPNCQLLRRYYS